MIRKINMTTKVIVAIAGTGVSGSTGNDGLATNAKLDAPNDLAIDESGSLYL